MGVSQYDIRRPSPTVRVSARGVEPNGFLEVAQRQLGGSGDEIRPPPPATHQGRLRLDRQRQRIVFDRAGEVIAPGLGEPTQPENIGGRTARVEVGVACLDRVFGARELEESTDAPAMDLGVVGIDLAKLRRRRRVPAETVCPEEASGPFRRGPFASSRLLGTSRRMACSRSAMTAVRTSWRYPGTLQVPACAGSVKRGQAWLERNRATELAQGQVELVLLSMDLSEGDMSAQLPGVQFDRLFQVGDGQVEFWLSNRTSPRLAKRA